MTLPLKCPNEDCPLVGTTKAGRCDLCKAYICNAEAPHNKITMKGSIIHPQAYEVGAQIDCYPLGDVVRMGCPLCNASWMKELPQ